MNNLGCLPLVIEQSSATPENYQVIKAPFNDTPFGTNKYPEHRGKAKIILFTVIIFQLFHVKYGTYSCKPHNSLGHINTYDDLKAWRCGVAQTAISKLL